MTLREFVGGDQGTLTLDERRLIVDQALVLLEQNYVHLPLKVAMHAVNPVQRLRLLQIRLERQTAESMDREIEFHAELSAIFHSVGDLHTNYLLPAPFKGKVAYLPFLIEDYLDADGRRRYVVSHVAQGFSAPGFERGVEVTHWSGAPIEAAVDRNAARFAGSNPAARRSRGVQSLTIRPLVIHLPPEEYWVTVSYLNAQGEAGEVRVEWLVVDNLPLFTADTDAVDAASVSLGLDLDGHATGRAKTLLFAPNALAGPADTRGSTAGNGRPAAPAAPVARATRTAAGPAVTLPTNLPTNLPTSMPTIFRARSVTTAAGTFGHLRIFSFNVQDPIAFVNEFVRLLGLLPQDGLIIDVRDNGGGHIYASEFTLQTLTPRRITPEPTAFINMPLNVRICRKHRDNPTGQIDLGPWFDSLDRAREIGATFSEGFAITPSDGANVIGQRYHGPVVLITNARCYSATDIFAAGFSDHRIGPILGVDPTTGAGGANVWTHGLLQALLDVPPADPQSPYRDLPKGADMRVAIRRSLRVGEHSGVPVEDLGVSPDDLHPMTRVDVLEDNRDLLDHAGRLLAALPVRALTVEAGRDPGGIRVDLQATNLDRVALWVDGEPRTSLDVSSGIGTVVIGDVPGARVLRVDGYSEGVLAAGRTIDLGPLEVLAPAEGADGGPRVAAPTRGVGASGSAGGPTVIYVHGAGNKPPRDQLTKQWDRDLFGRDMSGRTVMAYYADLLYAHPEAVPQDASTLAEAISLLAAGGASADGASSLDVNGSALDSNGSSRIDVAAGLDPDLLEQLTPEGRQLALSLAVTIAAGSASAAVQDPTALVDGILPFPWLRQILLRQLLQRLIPDANAYFFTAKKEPMRQRLRDVIDGHPGRLVVVSHSLGTAIAYDVLSEPRFAGRDVRLLTTLGCPLGYTEIQDVVTKPLAVPKPVRQWVNAADPLDVVCLDTTLSDDFHGQGRIIDVQVDNPSPDNHAPGGYLSAPQVRAAVSAVVSAVRA